ncbi:MAG: hypothetical protein N4A74_25575 [Carboxylicivirga sp.]|jgi:hypothetical protein|nr:hypothetical protein [Carboxylicivirga sp.]
MNEKDNIKISYNESYKLASKLIDNYCKTHKLKQLTDELIKSNVIISYKILSAIKNRRLPHPYPDTVEKLLRFFGGKNIKRSTETWYIIDSHQLNELKNSCDNGTKRNKQQKRSSKNS